MRAAEPSRAWTPLDPIAPHPLQTPPPSTEKKHSLPSPQTTANEKQLRDHHESKHPKLPLSQCFPDLA